MRLDMNVCVCELYNVCYSEWIYMRVCVLVIWLLIGKINVNGKSKKEKKRKNIQNN